MDNKNVIKANELPSKGVVKSYFQLNSLPVSHHYQQLIRAAAEGRRLAGQDPEQTTVAAGAGLILQKGQPLAVNPTGGLHIDNDNSLAVALTPEGGLALLEGKKIAIQKTLDVSVALFKSMSAAQRSALCAWLSGEVDSFPVVKSNQKLTKTEAATEVNPPQTQTTRATRVDELNTYFAPGKIPTESAFYQVIDLADESATLLGWDEKTQKVQPGVGLQLLSDTLQVQAGAGIKVDSAGVAVDLKPQGGLELDPKGLQVDRTTLVTVTTFERLSSAERAEIYWSLVGIES